MPSFSPLSSTPLGALPGDDAPIPANLFPDITSGVHFLDEAFPIFLNVLESSGGASFGGSEALIINALWDTANADSGQPLAKMRARVLCAAAGLLTFEAIGIPMNTIGDGVLLTTDGEALGNFKANATGKVAFADTIATAWQLLLADSGNAVDAANATVVKLLAIAETLQAVGAAEGRLAALAAVAVAVRLEDAVRSGSAAGLLDQATLLDGAQDVVLAMLAVADAVTVSADVDGSLYLLAIAEDGADVVTSTDGVLRMAEHIDDAALLFCTLRLGGFEYQGWAVNTDLRAVTEWRNVPFDSFALMGGRTYAAGENGIVELAGDTDDGTPIEAWFRTFLTDFGTKKMKRVTDVWLGGDAGGLYLKVHTKDPQTGAMAEDVYAVEQPHGAGTNKARVQVGRGLRSDLWGCTVRNINGADFKIDSISWRPLILDRRQ